MLSLAFGIGIGLTMALLFRADDAANGAAANAAFAGPGSGRLQRGSLAFLLLWVALLLAGTLKVAFLTASAAELMGLERELGTLEAGKIADVVVVDGDPFEFSTLRDIAISLTEVFS